PWRDAPAARVEAVPRERVTAGAQRAVDERAYGAAGDVGDRQLHVAPERKLELERCGPARGRGARVRAEEARAPLTENAHGSRSAGPEHLGVPIRPGPRVSHVGPHDDVRWRVCGDEVPDIV